MEAITLEELVKALEDAAGTEGECFSIAELREVRPMSADRARELVRKGIKNGLVRVSRKTITDMAGRPNIIPAYVFIPQKQNARS